MIELKLLGAFVMTVFYTTGFFGLDNLLAGGKFHDVSSRLDARIPLKPRWIWIYLLYYPMCFAPLLFPGLIADDSLYLRTAAAFAIQFLAAWAVFYFYPTRIPRPAVEGESWSARAVRGLFRADRGFNIFPSLHVANTVFIAVLSLDFLPAAASAGLFAAAGLIAASTVLIKQHYFADVPAGALLGLAAYWAAFSTGE
jgi:membrane-associated phospholipid phosphatase